MSKRSPSYPAHDLETAVEYAQKIYDADGRSAAGKNAVLRHMGFKGVSGASATALASLRQFGLVEGRGDSYKLTERARDILISPGEERQAALRDAALAPDIFREIWEKDEGRLPSDQNMRYYLEKERGFNKNSIESVVKNLRATVGYAELESQPDPDKNKGDEHRKPPLPTKTGPFGMIRDLDIPLQNGGVATFPVPMTGADHALLTNILSSLSQVHVVDSSADATDGQRTTATKSE